MSWTHPTAKKRFPCTFIIAIVANMLYDLHILIKQIIVRTVGYERKCTYYMRCTR